MDSFKASSALLKNGILDGSEHYRYHVPDDVFNLLTDFLYGKQGIANDEASALSKSPADSPVCATTFSTKIVDVMYPLSGVWSRSAATTPELAALVEAFAMVQVLYFFDRSFETFERDA
jgi:hypothetical protein